MKIRLAASVAAASGALLLAGTPAATAETPNPTDVGEQNAPNYKADFPVQVKDAQVKYRGQEISLDLAGKATFSVEQPTIGDLEGKASGTLTVSGKDPVLGKVTMVSQATGSVSFNSVYNPFPAKIDLSATGTMTIEKPAKSAGNAPKSESVALNSKDPAQLTGKLDQFPPKGEFTSLLNPVELVDADNPNDHVGTLEKFSIQVGDQS